MMAILDGTTHMYKVNRVWYHPRMQRELDRGLYVRSQDPKDGRVTLYGPDMAVVALTSEGPDLKDEVVLATEDELHSMLMAPIGVLGYGAKGGAHYWAIPPAEASFSCSILARLTDGAWNSEAAFASRELLWYDIDLGPGFSGGPVFNEGGHIVGIATSGLPALDNCYIDQGFRIDCLRELIAYHKLDEHIVEGDTIPRVDRRATPDPRLLELRHAVSLVKKAVQLRSVGRYGEATSLCDQALGVEPTYAAALLERSKEKLYYLALDWDKLKPTERASLSDTAYDDAHRAVELVPVWNEACIFMLQCAIYRTVATDMPNEGYTEIASYATHILTRFGKPYFLYQLTNWERAFALNVRAHAKGALGQSMEALVDYAESIEIDPENPRWYLNRAQFEESLGMIEEAAKDRESGRRRWPDEARH